MTGTLVREVMTTEVVTAEPSTPFKEIAGRLAQHRISAVPVVDADRRVLGIVTEADLLLKQEQPDPRRPSPYLDHATSPGTGQSSRGGGRHAVEGWSGSKTSSVRRRRRPGAGQSLDAPVAHGQRDPSHPPATPNVVALPERVELSPEREQDALRH